MFQAGFYTRSFLSRASGGVLGVWALCSLFLSVTPSQIHSRTRMFWLLGLTIVLALLLGDLETSCKVEV